MTGERLTRGELGWLLAQEARGAASALRAEVKELRNSLRPPPPPPSSGGPVRISGLETWGTSQEDRISSLPGERHLNTLDEAINLLANLQQQTNPRPKRRGRIDLAALLYELAPNCKLSLEPGAGTEVIGEEHELRRMFHLLLNQSTGGGDGATLNTIELKRQDQWIVISVELGPDAATSDLERRWLSRMAIKLGGRLELHGRRQHVILPAETSNREEVDQLKRELQQAQLLGEAYAKELASALAADVPQGPDSAPLSTTLSAGHWSDPIYALATALLPALQAAVRTAPGSPAIDALDGWARQLNLLTQIDTSPRPRGVLEVLTHVRENSNALAAKRSITVRDVTVATDAVSQVNVPTASLASILSLLVEHAFAATPTGGLVTLAVKAEHGALVFEVTDQGSAVPESMATGLVYGTIDPRSIGRPAGAALLLAAALAERAGAKLEVSSETEHTLVELIFD